MKIINLFCFYIIKLLSYFKFILAVSDIMNSLDPKFPLYRIGNLPDKKTSNLNDNDLVALMANVSSTPPLLQEKSSYNDQLVYIFTSGTTGLPKAAVITNSR